MSIKLRELQILDSATLPVLHNYSVYSLQPTVRGGITYQIIGPEPSMPGALYASVVNSASKTLEQDVQAVCSTGQCSFKEYTSLALEPRIADWTPYIYFGEAVVNDTATTTASLPIPDRTNLTLQVNNSMVPYPNMSAADIPYLNSSTRRIMIMDVYGLAFNTTDFGVFSYLNGTLVPVDINVVWPRFQAFHVQYQLVAETHKTSVLEGCLVDAVQEARLRQEWQHIEFWIHWSSGCFLSYLQWKWSILHQQHHDWRALPTWTNNYLEAIYANGFNNLNTTFVRVAKGLSNTLGPESNQTVSGVVIQSQSYYHARFGFLVLPALLVIATAVLILITNVRGRQVKAPVWKTDIMATIAGTKDLVHSSGSAAERPVETLRLGELEDWARDKKIVL